jgi:hypothetical protein
MGSSTAVPKQLWTEVPKWELRQTWPRVAHSLFKAFFFFSTPPATTLLTRFPDVFPLAAGVLAPGARPILPAWLEGWSTVDAARLGGIMVLVREEAFTEG